MVDVKRAFHLVLILSFVFSFPTILQAQDEEDIPDIAAEEVMPGLTDAGASPDAAAVAEPVGEETTENEAATDETAASGAVKERASEEVQASIAQRIRELEEEEGPGYQERKTIKLKMMMINPSNKYKQTYPMKVPLPKEVQPEHIIDRGDLELGFDSEKNSYYVSKTLELDPGASDVRVIELEDIWQIPHEDLELMADDGRALLGRLKGTAYEDRGRLLLNNIEVLLTQIFEKQDDESLTPQEHIQVYRENKAKMRDAELDLVSLRRLVAMSKGEADGLLPSKTGVPGMPGLPKDAVSGKSLLGGSIPAWMAWRIIFGIIFFVGFMSMAFFGIWQWQLRSIRSKRKVKAESESINMDALFGQNLKGSDAAAPAKPKPQQQFPKAA